MEAASYQVEWSHIPRVISPMNRILICHPLETDERKLPKPPKIKGCGSCSLGEH